jgi:hypothetical protein
LCFKALEHYIYLFLFAYSLSGYVYTQGVYICDHWLLVIDLNNYLISFVVYLVALLPVNVVLCSHPCLLGVLLGREITRMRRGGQRHR